MVVNTLVRRRKQYDGDILMTTVSDFHSFNVSSSNVVALSSAHSISKSEFTSDKSAFQSNKQINTVASSAYLTLNYIGTSATTMSTSSQSSWNEWGSSSFETSDTPITNHVYTEDDYINNVYKWQGNFYRYHPVNGYEYIGPQTVDIQNDSLCNANVRIHSLDYDDSSQSCSFVEKTDVNDVSSLKTMSNTIDTQEYHNDQCSNVDDNKILSQNSEVISHSEYLEKSMHPSYTKVDQCDYQSEEISERIATPSVYSDEATNCLSTSNFNNNQSEYVYKSDIVFDNDVNNIECNQIQEMNDRNLSIEELNNNNVNSIADLQTSVEDCISQNIALKDLSIKEFVTKCNIDVTETPIINESCQLLNDDIAIPPNDASLKRIDSYSLKSEAIVSNVLEDPKMDSINILDIDKSKLDATDLFSLIDKSIDKELVYKDKPISSQNAFQNAVLDAVQGEVNSQDNIGNLQIVEPHHTYHLGCAKCVDCNSPVVDNWEVDYSNSSSNSFVTDALSGNSGNIWDINKASVSELQMQDHVSVSSLNSIDTFSSAQIESQLNSENKNESANVSQTFELSMDIAQARHSSNRNETHNHDSVDDQTGTISYETRISDNFLGESSEEQTLSHSEPYVESTNDDNKTLENVKLPESRSASEVSWDNLDFENWSTVSTVDTLEAAALKDFNPETDCRNTLKELPLTSNETEYQQSQYITGESLSEPPENPPISTWNLVADADWNNSDNINNNNELKPNQNDFTAQVDVSLTSNDCVSNTSYNNNIHQKKLSPIRPTTCNFECQTDFSDIDTNENISNTIEATKSSNYLSELTNNNCSSLNLEAHLNAECNTTESQNDFLNEHKFGQSKSGQSLLKPTNLGNMLNGNERNLSSTHSLSKKLNIDGNVLPDKQTFPVISQSKPLKATLPIASTTELPPVTINADLSQNESIPYKSPQSFQPTPTGHYPSNRGAYLHSSPYYHQQQSWQRPAYDFGYGPRYQHSYNSPYQPQVAYSSNPYVDNRYASNPARGCHLQNKPSSIRTTPDLKDGLSSQASYNRSMPENGPSAPFPSVQQHPQFYHSPYTPYIGYNPHYSSMQSHNYAYEMAMRDYYQNLYLPYLKRLNQARSAPKHSSSFHDYSCMESLADDCESVMTHGEVTSDVDQRERHRATPPKFFSPHPTVQFVGDKFIVLNPFVNNRVEIRRLSLTPPKVLSQFPGPLSVRDTHKQDVIEFCLDRVKEIRDDESANDKSDKILLWKYLILLVRQSGKVVGSDISELLIGDIDIVSEEFFETEIPTPASIKRIRELILYGKRKDAINEAVKIKQWALALRIAKLVGEKAYAEVQAQYDDTFNHADPLHVCFQASSRTIPRFSNAYINEWRYQLAVIYANSSVDPEFCRHCIIALGDSLASDGHLSSSQLCYLLAEESFSYHGKPNARLVLIGAHSSSTLSQLSCDYSSIIQSCIYEYALYLGGNYYSTVPLQMLKYVYALQLLTYGLHEQALAYCEQIAEIIANNYSQISRALIESVYGLGIELLNGRNSTNSSHWIQMLGQILENKNAPSHNNINSKPSFENLESRQSIVSSIERLQPTSQHVAAEDRVEVAQYSVVDQGRPTSQSYEASHQQLISSQHPQQSPSNTYSPTPIYNEEIRPPSITGHVQENHSPVHENRYTQDTQFANQETLTPTEFGISSQVTDNYVPQAPTFFRPDTVGAPTDPFNLESSLSSTFNPSYDTDSFKKHYSERTRTDSIDSNKFQPQRPPSTDPFSNSYSSSTFGQINDMHRRERATSIASVDSYVSDSKDHQDEVKENAASSNMQRDISSNTSGLFGGIRGFVGRMIPARPNQVHLADEKSLVWDKENRRWLDTSKSAEEQSAKLPPPPVEVSGNPFSKPARAGSRSQYVDVMAKRQSTKSVKSPSVPMPHELFPPPLSSVPEDGVASNNYNFNSSNIYSEKSEGLRT